LLAIIFNKYILKTSVDVEHAAEVVEAQNAYKFFVEKPLEKFR
jgi:hypothetical protein